MIRGEWATGQDNWSEAQLQALILDAAKACGLLVYHTYDSRRSEAGFPDLVIVGRYGTLFRELKAAKGKVSLDQERWLECLLISGMDASVWRPEDWPLRILTEMKSLKPVTVDKKLTQEQIRQKYAMQEKQKARHQEKKAAARRRAGHA